MTIISEDGRFEWDSEKNKANKAKHSLSFEEILPIFDDPYFSYGYDEKHSLSEDRFKGVGSLLGAVVVVSSFVYRGRIRIINARRATKREEERYFRNAKDQQG